MRVLLERQSHRGREIRRCGVFEHHGMMPRASIDPKWWNWRKVFSAPWRIYCEHINVLELRAVLAGLEWRMRSKQNVHSKGLILMDSAVAIGALSKGRSPSQRLGPIVQKIDALLLASSFTPLIVWVRTDLNPADEPSRTIHK